MRNFVDLLIIIMTITTGETQYNEILGTMTFYLLYQQGQRQGVCLGGGGTPDTFFFFPTEKFCGKIITIMG